MFNRLRAYSSSALAASLLLVTAAGAQIEPANDAPQPKSPQDTLKTFDLPEGLKIQLVAAEPLLADPVTMCFDERGRLFVAEIHGYNLEGHLDIEELNKSGKLDREVRRIKAPQELREKAEQMTYGTVKLLVDENDDGSMDAVRIFANDLPACHGVIASRGGIIAICTTDIIFLADRDGDGIAEVRETLFTGYKSNAIERSMNNPRWGMDGWIYVGSGQTGGTVTGPHLKEPVTLTSSDFRFRPDGSAIEPVSGKTGTFGIWLHDFGDRFMIQTSRHALTSIPVDHRYFTRNPFVPSPDGTRGASNYQTIYPRSKPHPWRLARSKDPEWVKFYGKNETTPNGLFTAACSPLIYDAELLPAKYRGNHFCCEPQQNMLHRSIVSREVATYRADRAPEEQQSEFLTSTDQWFRPVNLAMGPAGELYIVDMYREIIEDYSAIPRFLQQQYGLINGNDRGRLWRIVSENDEIQTATIPADLSISQLVETLNDPNVWRRRTAQRLIIEKNNTDAALPLRRVIRSDTNPAAKVLALLALRELNTLEVEDVNAALTDRSYGVRFSALALSEPFLEESKALTDQVLAMIADADPRVRLQLALTLGETDDARATQVLADLAVQHGDDDWMADAIASSSASTSHLVLASILRRDLSTPEVIRLTRTLSLLSASAGARRDDAQIGQTLELIAAAPNSIQQSMVDGLIEGLKRRDGDTFDSVQGAKAIVALLQIDDPTLRNKTFELMGLLHLQDSSVMAKAMDRAADDVINSSLPLESRLQAASLLTAASFETVAEPCRTLLDARQPPQLQRAAVTVLNSFATDDVPSILLANWKTYSPDIRQAVIQTMMRRNNRIDALLTAIEDGRVPATAISTFDQLRLAEHADQSIRDRAGKLFTMPVTGDEDEAQLRTYMDALAKRGNAAKGKVIFEANCVVCHRVGDLGADVGPSLDTVRDRPDPALLHDILNPSARITTGYQAYMLEDDQGRILTGTLAGESATSIELRQADGKAATVLRSEVESIRALDQSLMPSNFAELISPGDMPDLVAFLRSSYGEYEPGVRILFEDDENLINLLSEGSGQLSITRNDVHSGNAALLLTPFQRHASRIEDWQFLIRERPAPGQYRFAQLCWKATTAKGIIIEFPASGVWPDAKRAERRYVSGENSSGWQAIILDEKPPGAWKTITIDLWQDNGDFTLTGLALGAMEGNVMFDRIVLLRSLDPLSEKK